MTNKNTYDYLNRLTGKTSALKFNYQYNGANQRARVTLLDGSYWVYGPDGWDIAQRLQMGSRKSLSSKLHHWRKTNEKHR